MNFFTSTSSLVTFSVSNGIGNFSQLEELQACICKFHKIQSPSYTGKMMTSLFIDSVKLAVLLFTPIAKWNFTSFSEFVHPLRETGYWAYLPLFRSPNVSVQASNWTKWTSVRTLCGGRAQTTQSTTGSRGTCAWIQLLTQCHSMYYFCRFH